MNIYPQELTSLGSCGSGTLTFKGTAVCQVVVWVPQPYVQD